MSKLDDLLLETEDKMVKAYDFFSNQLSGIRTGRASPGLVENISVAYYGSNVRLKEIASISTPEPRLIVLNAFDPSSLQAIEKGIIAANIGVTPMNDGRVIRVPFPELSEERRKDLVKLAKQMAEKGRVAIRAVRQESNETAKDLCKKSLISEDERELGLKEIQKLTDQQIEQIESELQTKESEIMEI
ncbi:MAG: ribosome recycling factor [Lentisphaerae bacterium]|jgi:ribosome recycling factor|nr:ribosome recycling factor [Lentisphaerota bacterium]